MSSDGPQGATSMPMARRLADWIIDFVQRPVNAATAERTRAILLDSLGCALYAHDDDKSQIALRAIQGMSGSGGCTIIGNSMRTTLPLASFMNGVLIRTLDFNDTYAGPRQVGHPSDNIGGALAAAEFADRSGTELLRAIILGYEIYGRILDMGDPESPWDHVTASGLVTAAMAGFLLRLPPERLAHALALAATHSATLGEVRVGHVSAAKSIANSVVVHTASLVTLLAAEGMTGPAHALEGVRGYSSLILDGVNFADFFAESETEDRIIGVGIKQYPCFALAQGPISAAAELRSRLQNSVDRIEKLTVSIADTGPARLRLRDGASRSPNSREAADHSMYVLVALALLDGQVGLEQFKSNRWRDADVGKLIDRFDVRIDPALQPPTALPCRLDAALAGGDVISVVRSATPGNPALPLSWADVEAKFRQCADKVMSAKAQKHVITQVEGIDDLKSVRNLMALLTTAEDS
jgi:2-methylcitrate dehydratase